MKVTDRRPVLFSALIVAMTASVFPLARAATGVIEINESIPVAYIFENPCTPMPDFIELSGNIQVQGSLAIDDSLKLATLRVTVDTRGVSGQGFALAMDGARFSTGVRYTSSDQIQISVTTPHTPVIAHEKFKLVSQVSTDNFLTAFRLQVSDAGLATIDILGVASNCHG